MNDRALNERELLLRDTPTAGERLTYWLILIAFVTILFFAPHYPLATYGVLMTIGILMPVALKMHQNENPFIMPRLWSRWTFTMLPTWLIIVATVVGLFNPATQSVTIDGTNYRYLADVYKWLPKINPTSNSIIQSLGFSGLLSTFITLTFVPKSRYFIERLLLGVASIIAIFAACRYIALIIDPSTFPKTHFFDISGELDSWSLFSILWTTVFVSLALLIRRYNPEQQVHQTLGPILLVCAIMTGGMNLLLLSGPAIGGAFVYIGLLLIYFSMISFRAAAGFRFAALFIGLGAILGIIYGVSMWVSATTDPLINAYWNQVSSILFSQSPLFGWSWNSQLDLFGYFANDALIAKSDALTHRANWLSMLASFGIVGTTVFALVIATLARPLFAGRFKARLANELSCACLVVAIFGLLGIASQSLPTIASLAFLFALGVRWSALSRRRLDEIAT